MIIDSKPGPEAGFEGDLFLGLGSNLGDKEKNLRTAVNELSGVAKIIRVSSIYLTEPWGRIDLNDFLNIVCLIRTKLHPREILEEALKIEHRMGRKKRGKWEPRIIDIDILFAGRMVIDEIGLTIPHPFVAQRRFVLEPLTEIASDYRHPISGKTAPQMLRECRDACKVALTKKWD